MGIGARHLTVSTCGLVDSIRRFAEEPEQFTLAVSLHSAIQETRDRLMPALINQPLSLLGAELAYYASTTGRRPSLEYALIAGVNDSAQELSALIDFASGRGALGFHVNLIALNSVGVTTLTPSSVSTVRWFASGLQDAGINVTIRVSRGADIQAACGQLVGIKAPV
jgi:23S rRNA (adenine2503-C2)-methyltransferase